MQTPIICPECKSTSVTEIGNPCVTEFHKYIEKEKRYKLVDSDNDQGDFTLECIDCGYEYDYDTYQSFMYGIVQNTRTSQKTT